jgi:EAL domain-containing protein (putative c-di-GMP-specific phosphodiesterase class I)
MLIQAELALQEAKKKGGNCMQLFRAEMSESVWKRFSMERDLHRALDNDEFFLVYQPQVNLQTRDLVAAEALVRWRHPERGLINPGEFISLAEEVGLIRPLGSWVLRQACMSARSWQLAGFRAIPVAVNVSAVQFADEGLVTEVETVLHEFDLESHYLELEVTEGVLMQDMARSVSTLKKLKELGVTLAIDDFGTGYSSLSYLTRFPLDRLKLDRSFVQDLHRKRASAEVARAVITLAHALGLEVVAEGVETMEEYDFLRQMACEYVQGYYVSKPVDKERFEADFLQPMARD